MITVDEVLRAGSKGRFSLPPLAVGMGMYLPIQLTLTIPLGALIGLLYNRWAERTGKNVEGKKRTGILLATGLIVGGESLFGVVLAGVVAATGNEAPLAVVGSGYPEWLSSTLGGVLVFLGIIWVLYRWIRRITARDDELDAG